jgi:ATP-binding cassette subfamily B protein
VRFDRDSAHTLPRLPVSAVAFLLHYVWRHLAASVLLLIIVTSGALSAVGAQYGLKLLVDGMTDTHPDQAEVLTCLGLFLGLLAVESICWRAGGFLGSRTIICIGEDIRLDLFRAVSARPLRFFNGQASGALAGRTTSAAASATAVMRTVLWNVLPPVMDLVGSMVVSASIDWRIAGVLVVVAAAATFTLHHLGQRGLPHHQAYHSAAANVSGVLADVLANMGLVKSYGARFREQEGLRLLMQQEGRAHRRSWVFLERLRCLHDVAFWFANAAVLTAAVSQWSKGAISTGGVVVATTLTLRILAGSREMALSLLGLSQQVSAVTEAVEVLRIPPDEIALAALPPLPAPGRTIELRQVRYSPEGGNCLFDCLDLYVRAGERVGIVGASGAGKSTLLRLVQGVIPPDSGSVLLDGKRLADHAPDSLVHAFCVVSQEVPLFHRSVADNLAYGRPDADGTQVLAVSRAVGCDAFIEELPNGYDTIVGERGVRLSGGQRQRIAVARALLRDAPVLLLDEATSALDSAAEVRVQKALLKLAGQRTIIAVAHRLSTLRDFDRIVVLERGQVVEDGSPAQLRAANGHFAQMWRLQHQAEADTEAERPYAI